MSTGTRLLLATGALAAIAILGVVIFGQRGAPLDPTPVQDPPRAVTSEPAPAPIRTESTTPDTAATRRTIDTAPSPNDAPHGFRGRIVDRAGTPIEGAIVYLVEGHANDPFTALVQQNRMTVLPPVAKAVADRSGRFELRVRAVAQSGYEIHAVSERYAEAAVGNLSMFAGRLVDVGDVVLPDGIVLHGRVTVLGSDGFPVPDAIVTVRSTNVQQTFAATPGREDGIEVHADAAGAYVVENVGAGFVTVTAVAPGFARIVRENVDVKPGIDNRVDFELPKGESIAGVITGRDGRPLAGARVEAIQISARTPATAATRSDADGRFEVLGLVEAPYLLVGTAIGFVRTELKPVRAGSRDVRLTLPAQGSALVRVLDAGGRPLDRFDLLVRAYHAEQDALGRVANAHVERVLPADLEGDAYRIHNLDPAAHDYVVQVDVDGYARTFSPPFRITLDGDAPRVDVPMSPGGILRGRAITEDGRPLGEASVTTLPNFLDDTPFAAMVGNVVPNRITETRVRCDGAGRFEIALLAAGTYQLRIEHDGYCATSVRDVEVRVGDATTVPDVVMPRGTRVVGTVLVDGAPAGQVKIAVSSVADPNQPSAAVFRAEAISDDEGNFALSRRVPPGRYVAQAARQTLPNPLLLVADYQKTRVEFVVAPGQVSKDLHFTLASN